MENLLKKQLAQIKARALAIASRAAADTPLPETRDTSNEIVDAVVKTGAVVRGAEFEASRKPPRFAWWRRRREVRASNEYGYEGAFQRLLSSFGDEAAVPIEEAVPGEPQVADESAFYLIRAAGDAIDTTASEQASRFAAFRSWPSATFYTRIGAQPIYGVRESVEVTGEASPSSVLFLDIETAGLSANTYVFLVGLMYWAEGEFRVEQVFARDYTEEEGLLRYVRSTLERFDTVVTYNGAAFDLPFLRTRMTVHRIPDVEPVGRSTCCTPHAGCSGRRSPTAGWSPSRNTCAASGASTIFRAGSSRARTTSSSAVRTRASCATSSTTTAWTCSPWR